MELQELTELLAEAAEEPAAAIDLTAEKERVRVNMQTRKIHIGNIVFGNVHDHLARRIILEMDRYADGVDLLDKNIAIHWENGKNGGVYPVQETDPSEDGKILFRWTITNEFTQEAGNIIFAVHCFTVVDGAFTYHISTNAARAALGDTLCAAEHSEKNITPGETAQYIQRMNDLSAAVDSRIAAIPEAAQKAVEAYLEENPPGVDMQDVQQMIEEYAAETAREETENYIRENRELLRGEPGKDGLPGRDGLPGKDGADGRDGTNGKDGEPGKDGLPGRDGTDGKDGAPGKDGPPGKDGAPGKDGPPGKDGADYILTASDRAEIAAQAAELVDTDSVPSYVRAEAEAVAEKILSVTGEAAESGGAVTPYTNQLPISTDESGSVYNGCGYREGYRLGSNGAESIHAGMFVTGYIPCRYRDIVRLRGISMDASDTNASNFRIAFYDSGHTQIGQTNAKTAAGTVGGVCDAEGNLTEFQAKNFAGYDLTNAAYCRLNGAHMDGSSIITVNQEISEPVAAETEEALPFRLAFLSDIHLSHTDPDNASVVHASQGLAEISNRVDLDAVVFGGDYVANWILCPLATLHKQMTGVKNHFHAGNVPQIWVRGNHDGNPFPDLRASRADVYNRVLRGQPGNAVSNPADPFGGYGYVDFDSRRVRVIYVNTSDNDSFGNPVLSDTVANYSPMLDANNVSGEQLQWIADHALDFTGREEPAKWGIVIVSHTDLETTGTVTNADGMTFQKDTAHLAGLLAAYRSGTSYSATVNSHAVHADYSGIADRADIICHIHGHTHNLSGSNPSGIRSVGCPNVSYDRARVSDDGKIYDKVTGTADDTAFTVFSIDRTNRKIHAYCYGAGYDRVFDY